MEDKKIPVINQDEPIPSISPEIQGMDFYEALKDLRNGLKIRRLTWKKDEYGILKDGFVAIHKPDGILHNWNISDGDLDGKDWIIIN
jgi:hypothetical protein